MATTKKAAKDPLAEINKNPFQVAMVELVQDGEGLAITDVTFEWFNGDDPLGAAKEYASDLATWADEEVTEVGECYYIVAVIRTGKTLTVEQITSHGFTSSSIGDTFAAVFVREPDKLLLTDESVEVVFDPKAADNQGKSKKVPATKPKAPVAKKVEARKGIVPAGNAPTPKARPKPTRSAPAVPSEETKKPLVRSRGFRDAARKKAS